MKAAVPKVAARKSEPGPGGSGNGHMVKMVEFRGSLPEQPAKFLSRLQDHEKRDVYAILGSFQEIRGLVGVARLLHAFLKEAPLAAARGRTTFEEVILEKRDILGDIVALIQKITRAAENVCLILPRVPKLRIKEVNRVHVAYRRVS